MTGRQDEPVGGRRFRRGGEGTAEGEGDRGDR